MNKFLTTAAAATVAFAMAPSANATVTDFCPDTIPACAVSNAAANGTFHVVGNPSSGPVSAHIGHTLIATGDFTDNFNFVIPQDGLGSGLVGNIVAGIDGDIDFTDGAVTFFNGVTTYFATVLNVGGISQAYIQNATIINGNPNILTINGKVITAPASYGGDISFTPVPEPTTWAMMLVGFGLVGFAMRRRQSVKTSVSYAA